MAKATKATKATKRSRKAGRSVATRRTAATPPADGASGSDRLYTAQIRELVELMVANDLTALEIVNGQLKVSLGRGQGSALRGAMPANVPAPAAIAADVAASAKATGGEGEASEAEKLTDWNWKLGSGKTAGETVVCIVEAMKVMNEIKAECSGTIVEAAVENGQPVEYGQVLFRTRP